MFVALHGSWNRAERQGYKLAFIPFKDKKAVAGPEDFVSGWMLAPDKKEVWGRPVGLLQMPDGSLLLTDDGGRKIWRIAYKGYALLCDTPCERAMSRQRIAGAHGITASRTAAAP